MPKKIQSFFTDGLAVCFLTLRFLRALRASALNLIAQYHSTHIHPHPPKTSLFISAPVPAILPPMPRALTKLLLIASLFFGTGALGHTRIDQAEQHADIAPSKHPFFAPLHHTFVPAGELSEGSPLSLSNGTRATALGLRRRAANAGMTTYNFEVEDFHTYFVGRDILQRFAKDLIEGKIPGALLKQ